MVMSPSLHYKIRCHMGEKRPWFKNEVDSAGRRDSEFVTHHAAATFLAPAGTERR